MRVVLFSALFPENTWVHFMMACWLAIAEDKKKIANKDQVLGLSSNLTQPQSDHVVMKSSVSIACGSHEYKALPIVPVIAAARLLHHMPFSITAQQWPRS